MLGYSRAPSFIATKNNYIERCYLCRSTCEIDILTELKKVKNPMNKIVAQGMQNQSLWENEYEKSIIFGLMSLVIQKIILT